MYDLLQVRHIISPASPSCINKVLLTFISKQLVATVWVLKVISFLRAFQWQLDLVVVDLQDLFHLERFPL